MYDIYSKYRFIDLNALINADFNNVYTLIDDFQLSNTCITDKNTSLFVCHSLLNKVLTCINSFTDFYCNIVYINKQAVKNLLYTQLFNGKDFYLFYKKFILILKKSIGLRVIVSNYTQSEFIYKLSNNDPTIFDIFNDSIKKSRCTTIKSLKFCKQTGLQQVYRCIKTSPRLKMHLNV